MTAAASVAIKCGICDSGGRRAVIDTLLAAGRPLKFIEREMKGLGQPTKAETIKRHLTLCLKGDPFQSEIVRDGMPSDFAARVQQRAIEAMDAGQLHVRTQDGLAAQALLDRRAEKQADREMLMRLAHLMSGSRSPAPDNVIEGHATLLAPPALIVVE
jgi:hypothetical protein